MSVEPEPYMEPADGAQDDSTAASRKRHSMAYRASHDGSIEVRDVAASESGTDEFSSTVGDDTFTSTMLKILTAATGGEDDIIVIDIYDLLRRAQLDTFLLNSLRAGCQLEGDEFAPSDETLAKMVASAQAAVEKACIPVSGALIGAMDKASKFQSDRIKDLLASNTNGSESQQTLDRIREEKVDVAFRSTYKALEELCAEIETMKKTRASMLKAREKVSFDPLDWQRLNGKSSEEILESVGKLNPNQISIEKIDKCVVGVDKRIAEATKQRHTEMIDSIGMSASVNEKDPTPSEFEALAKLGLLPQDKHTAVKADAIRTWTLNFMTKHSGKFWAVLPTIHRMLIMDPNRDVWKIPTSEDVCAADFEAARVLTGIGPLVAEHFNLQNMELLNLMASGRNCLPVLEAVEQQLTHGDDGHIERTVQGKKDDWISHIEAVYWPNALTLEKDRAKMLKIVEEIHVEFLRPNQDLKDGIKVVTKIITLARRMQVSIPYNKCAKRIVRAILHGRKSFVIPEISIYLKPPTEKGVRDNCIHMLCDMLAKIGRAADRYESDHSGESISIADYESVNFAMASSDLEVSVSPGYTDQDMFDEMIKDICPQFDRSDFVTSAHSVNFAGNFTGGGGKGKDKRGGKGGRGGKGKNKGRGGDAKKQVTKNITYPAGKLTCSVERCSNKLSVGKSDTFRATDEQHRAAAADGGRYPYFSPICSTCWASDKIETLQMDCATPGKKMNMPAYQKKSGHTGGKGAHSVNAATAAVVDNSDNISDAGSATSAVSSADSAKENLTSAIAEAQKFEPSLKVTMESISEDDSSSSIDRLAQSMGDMQGYMTQMRSEQQAHQHRTTQHLDTLQRQQAADRANQQSSMRTGGLGGGHGSYIPPGYNNQQQTETMGAGHNTEFPLLSDRVAHGMQQRLAGNQEVARRK